MNSLSGSDNKRLIWLDVLKGVAILLVVLGHQTSEHQGHALKTFIYSFHMPFFFLLAGYSAALSMSRSHSIASFLKKRAIGIIIPLVVWAFCRSLIFGDVGAYRDYSLEQAAHSLLTGSSQVWFLPCLFLLQTYFCAYCFFTRQSAGRLRRLATAAALLLAAFALHRSLGHTCDPGMRWDLHYFTSAFVYFVPFAFGIALFRHPLLFEWFARGKAASAISILIVLFGCIATRSLPYANYSKTVTGLAASCLLLQTFYPISASACARCLATVGKSTLIIYLAAPLFQPTSIPPFAASNEFVSLIFFLAATAFTCGLCIALEKILLLSPSCALLFLGKRAGFRPSQKS